jgi:radical SAM superfamily enzyme YgiQ (UPF0313 family)
MRNALLVYPEFPPSYWGFKYAIELLGKKSAMPPLGLLTVAGMFSRDYRLKVVDLNVEPLTDAHLAWADMVFTSTMIVQRGSLYEVIRRCNRAGVPIVAGGPHPTTFHDEIRRESGGGVAHFLLGEVENTFDDFLTDIACGTARDVYPELSKPAISKAPLPRYDLLRLRRYNSMALQFSRGCPFDCEFCDITKLYGRTKDTEQMLGEFELLYHLGWRGSLFLVDDNFIGNKRNALRLLPRLREWQAQRGYPFSLFTEASMNLAHVPELLDSMSAAGFDMVFMGIESPNPDTLLATNKKQNIDRSGRSANYLLDSVRTVQSHGLEVSGGFIIGLDGDTEFDSHIRFVQEAGIPLAMAGLLTALKSTDLYERLAREGRLLGESTGDNTDGTLNFVPLLPRERLMAEYKRVVGALYDPSLKNYFERCMTLLRRWRRVNRRPRRIRWAEILAAARSLRRQVLSRQGPAYLRFLLRVLRERPAMIPEAIRLAIMGFHFEKITRHTIAADDFRRYLETELEAFKARIVDLARTHRASVEDAGAYVREVLSGVRSRYDQLHVDFRHAVHDAVTSFEEGVMKQLEELGLEIEGQPT